MLTRPADAAGATPAEPSPPAGGRDAYLDNVKCVAIVLVVIGHFLTLVLGNPLARELYLWIYSFHMPVFVLVSGYLSRRFTGSPGQYRKLLTTILVPYVVFQTIYQIEGDLLNGRSIRIDYVDPAYVLWFLMSLFLWRLATPLILQLRWPLAFAVLACLGGGLSDQLDGTLSLGRTFGLLPFFVTGLLLRPEHFALLTRPRVRAAGAAVLVAGFGVIVLLEGELKQRWFYWRDSYHDAGLSNAEGLLMRAVMLVVATLMGTAFMALIPRGRSLLSSLGVGTMYAFLLHGLITSALKDLGTFDDVHHVLVTPLIVLLGLGVGLTLLSPPVRRWTRWLVEFPAGERVLRPREEATGRPPGTVVDPQPGPRHVAPPRH